MKKLFSLALLVSLIFMFGCTNNLMSTTESTELQRYKNKTNNFSIQFPITREFEENVYESDVIFFTPMEENDTIRENISINKEELEKNYNLDEHYILTKTKLENTIPEFVEISKENITINNNSGYKIIFQGIQGKYKIQWQQICFIKDTIVYIITYTATQDTFGEFIEEVDAMINTLKIK